MNRVIILAGSTVVSLLLSASALGQQKLTLARAIQLGLDHNITLQQQRNQLGFTQANETSNLLRMAPTVTVSASAGRFDGNSFNQQLGRVVNGQLDFVNGSAGATMPVFGGFSQVNAYRQARSENEAQGYFVARTQQDIIRNIAFQYMQCLLNQQLLRIDEENIKTQQAQWEQIKAQVELGASAEADLLNQEFQVRNAELLHVRSSNRLRNDLAQLAQLLLINPQQKFELEDPNWATDLVQESEVPLEEWNRVSLEKRGDLKRADLLEKAARLGYQSVRGQQLPTITAFAFLNSRYNYIFGFDENRPFSEQFRNDNRQLNYGLSLDFTVFNGFRQRARVVQAKVNYENAKLAHAAAEVQVQTDVLLAYQNLQDAVRAHRSAEAQVRAAELSYRTEKERYDLGISNIVQLTVANQAFVRAQSDYANARYTLMFQRLLMDYATGTLQADELVKN